MGEHRLANGSFEINPVIAWSKQGLTKVYQMRAGLVGPWLAVCSVFEKADAKLLHFSSQDLLKKQGGKPNQQHFSRTD